MSRRDEDENAATLPVSNPSGTDATLTSQDGGALADGPPELQPGDSLGRYALAERLGAGAMGVVWAARDPRLDRRIAIKVVHPRLARTAEASSRLLREARAMAKLSHRSVVTVHDAGEVDGRLYIAMELVEGTTLGNLLRTRTPDELANWRRWLDILIAAGGGLAAAHRQGVLHRDFKPDNVLVDRVGRVCVADFGLASLGGEASGPPKATRDSIPLDLTQTGTLLGTPAYMSPQQLRGELVDERADQFAFCVAAWESLYGARPFTTNETGLAALTELADTIASGVRPPRSTTVPPAVGDVLVRGLANEPADRWPTMDALVTALTEAAQPRKRTASHAATSSRRPRWTWPLVGGLVVTALALGFVLLRWRAPTRTTRQQDLRLFPVTLRSRLAISNDGKRIALGGPRIEVRELDGKGYWSTLPPLDKYEIAGLAIDGDSITFGQRNVPGAWTWHYTTDANALPPTDQLPGAWYGHTILGDLVYVWGEHPTLRIIDHGREIVRWDVSIEPELARPAPNGRRLAYVDGIRSSLKLVLRDLTTGREDSIGPFPGFTALAWRDDNTLLYALGNVDGPQIHSVAVTSTGFGADTVFHELDTGWIGTLAASPQRVLFIEMGVTSRTRLIERAALTTHEFDTASVAAPLGWVDATTFLVWNRSTKQIERRVSNAVVGATPVTLQSEPANATVAGDILITSLRANEGRLTLASSLTTGKVMWKHEDMQTYAVRCALDKEPPCFAIHVGTGADKVERIDPTTGVLGDVITEGEHLEDIAVNAGGTRLLVGSTSKPVLREIALDAPSYPLAREILVPTGARSISYDHDGGLLMTGTVSRNTNQAGRLAPDGTFSVIIQTENDILSMARSSPDGRQLLLLSRSYAPSLWQVQ